jgi:GTPase SAR1 family protein
MLKNIVLVGTKTDLLSDHPRQVTFKEAIEFANKMGLAGVLETSSKLEHEKSNIEDSFYICACNCVSKEKREKEAEEALRKSSRVFQPIESVVREESKKRLKEDRKKEKENDGCC